MALFVAVVAGGAAWWRWSHPAGPLVTVTPLGGHQAKISQVVNGRMAVVCAGPATDDVLDEGHRYATEGRVRHFLAAPWGRHLAWVVAVGERTQLVVDGRLVAWDTEDVRFLEDGRLTYAAKRAGVVEVVVDGQVLGRYDRVTDLGGEGDQGWEREPRPVPPPKPQVGPFWRGHRGSRVYLVAGLREYGPFQEVGEVQTSHDDLHWVCTVRRDGRETLLWDGRLLAWHEQVTHAAPGEGCCCNEGGPSRFTADGQHVVWQTNDGQRGRLWVDERPFDLGRRVRYSLYPKVTGDGSHIFWLTNNQDARWLMDGRPLPGGDSVSEEVVVGAGPSWAAVVGAPGKVFVASHLGRFGPFAQVTQPVVSAADGRLVFAARSAEGWRMWTDGRPGDVLVNPNPPRFECDDRLAVATCRDDRGRTALWVDGRLWPWLDELIGMDFARDGAQVACRGRLGDQEVALADGRVVAAGYRVQQVDLSNSGRRLLAVCSTGRLAIPWMPKPVRRAAEGLNVQFSADERHWVYVNGCGADRVVVHDGRESERFSFVQDPKISPNGRHAVAQVERADERARSLWADGFIVPLGETDPDHEGWFGADGVYRIVARSGSGSSLVELRWPR